MRSKAFRYFLRLLKKAKKKGKEFTVVGAAWTLKTVLTDSNMDTLLDMREPLYDL